MRRAVTAKSLDLAALPMPPEPPEPGPTRLRRVTIFHFDGRCAGCGALPLLPPPMLPRLPAPGAAPVLCCAHARPRYWGWLSWSWPSASLVLSLGDALLFPVLLPLPCCPAWSASPAPRSNTLLAFFGPAT